MDNTKLLVNTNELRREALQYKKHGYYHDAPEGTKSFYEYWDEQRRRCIEGYSVGGLRITGYHYFYLNFTPILLIDEMEEGKKSATKIETFPHFWDGDYNYYWALEIARNGMEEEKVENLGLGFTPLDTSGGRHMVVLKARGKGYSYKAGSMLARHFAMGNHVDLRKARKSKTYAMAYEKEFLKKDGVLSKAWDTIDFLDANTPFQQPRLIDRELHKKAGYKQKQGGSYVEKGTKNEIMGVTLKDDPDRARGKRGDLILFEEAGKFPGLDKAWEMCRPSVEQGAYTTGTMIAYGTGGTEEGDYEALEKLFYNPDAHNVFPVNNIWDEGAEGRSCGFFVPAYMNWQGYMDENGNSDIEGAKAYLEQERERKKSSDDPTDLEQYTSENPFTPMEATLRIASNIFPTAELQAQLNSVKAEKRYRAMSAGNLYVDSDGDVRFRPSQDAKPIYQYPTPKKRDTAGAVTIKESPQRDESGKVPNNLYVVCHDPYAHDGQPEGGSLGAAYVLKRTNNFSSTLNECIVASYVARPEQQDEYNRNLFMLAEYYNAKIGFENNRGSVVTYAKRKKKLSYLAEKFDIMDSKERKRGRRRTSVSYGITMNKSRKNQGQVYLRDWLTTPIAMGEEGEEKLVLHTILDPALLQELIKYNEDGNFDRVSALFIGMYHLKELETQKIAPKKAINKRREFFQREWFK